MHIADFITQSQNTIILKDVLYFNSAAFRQLKYNKYQCKHLTLAMYPSICQNNQTNILQITQRNSKHLNN